MLGGLEARGHRVQSKALEEYVSLCNDSKGVKCVPALLSLSCRLRGETTRCGVSYVWDWRWPDGESHTTFAIYRSMPFDIIKIKIK